MTKLRPRGLGWACAFTTVGLLAGGLRLRGRLGALTRIGSGERGHPRPGADDGLLDGWRLLAAEGVHVEPEALAAAVRYARRAEVDALDLVPADLDAERAIDLARNVDPATFRGDRFAVGRGANQALLIREELLDRIGETDATRPLVEADLVDLLAEAKRFAPTTTDVALLEGLHASPELAVRRMGVLRATYTGAAPLGVVLPVLGVGALAAGVAVSPVWGTAALAAYLSQPTLALGGSALSEQIPSLTSALRRPLRTVHRAVAAGRAAADLPDTATGEQAGGQAGDDARARYADLLAGGVERFFEERRTTCPWCGSDRLSPLLVCTDVLQAKPGEFHLERCDACRHVFQNPRLSIEGLDFYYGDFYDGLGATELELVFQSSPTPYRGRADLVRRNVATEPESWLDVGSGHAHFCLLAAEHFPQTRFEGLDLNDAIDEAERRGWIAEAHRGLFPDVAGELSDRYDVVSMHHYLEHTREPRDELAAAAKVLHHGGHLLIEVPDPECVYGRVMGRWWGPWFQPQHQHLIPMANLCEALEEEGFRVVATEHGPSHQPVEAAMGAWLLLNAAGPPVGLPWQPEGSTALGTIRRVAVFAAGSPLVALGLVADQVMAPWARRARNGSNAYRVLARRA